MTAFSHSLPFFICSVLGGRKLTPFQVCVICDLTWARSGTVVGSDLLLLLPPLLPPVPYCPLQVRILTGEQVAVPGGQELGSSSTLHCQIRDLGAAVFNT